MKKQKTRFRKTLLAWYRKHKRDLPWRRAKDPYKIWISEIMLQQTQVATVIDYYRRFLKRFPNIASLAKARQEEVLALWSGLGYYSRAKNLHRAAQKIVAEHRGKFPEDPEAIRSLPGIGRYTLGAIASIAFDLPLALVDGNVIRVYSRLFALKGSPKDTKFQKEIWKIAEEIIFSPSPQPSPSREREKGSPGDFNQALMDLGATICTPIGPLCPICPIQKFCKGRFLGPERFPEKKKGPETKLLKRIAAVIEKDGKILLTLSEKHRWMKSLWQLPSRFSENGESPPRVLDQLLKELGIPKTPIKVLPSHTHQITHHRITLIPFRVKAPLSPQPKGEVKIRWISPKEASSIPLPATDRKVLKTLEGIIQNRFNLVLN